MQNRGEYDRGVNTFSPEGRLFQVEYALAAVNLGSTALAIKTSEGVVFASERRVPSPLAESYFIEKIFEIDSHLGCASSGLVADARTLVDHGRVEAQHYWFTYDEKIPVESTAEIIADIAMDFSDVNDRQRKKIMSRPFGVSLLLGGFDDDGKTTSLWMTDPSGTTTEYKACAVGSAQEGADSMLHEQYRDDMTLQEAENLVLVVLRQVMEENLTSKNVELATVSLVNGKPKFCSKSPETIEAAVQRMPPAVNPLH